jgi:diacylglycerol kinase (ATP)
MAKKFISSFKYARAGAEHAWRTQRNLWVHFLIGLIVLLTAIYLSVSLVEMSILVLVIFNVIAVEMLNTAVEEMVNILSPGYRKEAALAKNVAAAAVLVVSVGSILIGCFIFIPRIFILCSR